MKTKITSIALLVLAGLFTSTTIARAYTTIGFLEPGANLSGANLTWIGNVTGANLTGANLTGADLSGVTLSYAGLYNANLSDTYLWGINLTGADLYSANLTGARLGGANLTGARVSYANWTDFKNNSGATNLDNYSYDTSLIHFDSRTYTTSGNLSPGSNLSGANLTWIGSLTGFDLSGANLTGADLSVVNLSSVGLFNANLSDTYLWDVNLTGADLTNATLTGARLGGANLTGATVSYANWTDFKNNSGATNLDNYSYNTSSLNYANAPAVPEPSTYGLIGVAALGVAFAARRRKLKKTA